MRLRATTFAFLATALLLVACGNNQQPAPAPITQSPMQPPGRNPNPAPPGQYGQPGMNGGIPGYNGGMPGFNGGPPGYGQNPMMPGGYPPPGGYGGYQNIPGGYIYQDPNNYVYFQEQCSGC